MTFLIGLWPLVVHYGLSASGVALLGALAWLVPAARRIGIWGVALLVALTFSYAVGVHDGEDRINKQWAATEQRIADLAGKAQDDAERSIPPVVDEPSVVPRVPPAGLRNARPAPRACKPLDKYDRCKG